MIRLSKVAKSYGTQRALDGVDLSIEKGECAVLIGPSGCGKSTLLKTINAMVTPDSGEVFFDGVDVKSYKSEELRRRIGYCIQGVGLFPHFTVEDNIAVVPRLLKWPEQRIKARIGTLMDLGGLPQAYLEKRPHELSGGEAQRVGVLRSLAADPPVLLMDEPFGAVDPMTRERLQFAFMDIQRELKKTVVFVTHDIEEAILIADRLVVMNNGRIEGNAAPWDYVAKEKSEFVGAFLGTEYPLKLLRRVLAASIGSADAFAAEQAPCEAGCLPPTANLKEVLSEMMRTNASSVLVKTPDNGAVRVGYADIARLFTEVKRS
jgi:osmoprotectant transport system ATP-binding protein